MTTETLIRPASTAGRLAASARRADGWLLSPAPAERLAVLRILIGGFAAVYVVAAVGEFARVTRLPAHQFEPVGVAGWLSGPASTSTVWAFFALTVVLGAAYVAGFAFRLTGPLFGVAVLIAASYHSSWGQMLHFEHLFTMHVIVIGLSPAADALSFDARSRRESSPGEPAVKYGWPIRLAAIITAVTYVIAGVTKLTTSGLDWVDSSNLGNHIAYSATRMDLLGGIEPPLAPLVVGRGWLIAPAAVIALVIELAAPVALAGGRWRRWWVVGALVLHAATAATMFVFFPYRGLGFALLPLFAVERLIPSVRRRWIAIAGP